MKLRHADWDAATFAAAVTANRRGFHRSAEEYKDYEAFLSLVCLNCGHRLGSHISSTGACTRPTLPGYPEDTNTLPAWMLEDKP